jgi:predicted site-specific integrase-resolvase
MSIPPAGTDTSERISRKEAARRLGVHPATVDRYCGDGLIRAVRATVGRRTWLIAADVERVRLARLGLDQVTS